MDSKKHIEKRLTSLVIRKIKLKPQYDTIIYLLEWEKILTILSVDKNTVQPEHSYIAYGNAKWYNHLGKQFGILFLIRLTINLPYNPAIP